MILLFLIQNKLKGIEIDNVLYKNISSPIFSDLHFNKVTLFKSNEITGYNLKTSKKVRKSTNRNY